MNSAQPGKSQQPDRTILGTSQPTTRPTRIFELIPCPSPGEFGAAPTQQRYEPAVRPGDTLNENNAHRQGPDYRNAASSDTGPADIYTSHAGQLGATGGRSKFNVTSTVGNIGTGAGREFNAPGQNSQTYGGGPGIVPPPPAVPQPRAHAVQPSTSDKLMGQLF